MKIETNKKFAYSVDAIISARSARSAITRRDHTLIQFNMN
jgi:hypothetical protein